VTYEELGMKKQPIYELQNQKYAADRGVFHSARIYQMMKNGVFWDVTPCGSCKNRRFGGA
jgi:hypothetical protein